MALARKQHRRLAQAVSRSLIALALCTGAAVTSAASSATPAAPATPAPATDFDSRLQAISEAGPYTPQKSLAQLDLLAADVHERPVPERARIMAERSSLQLYLGAADEALRIANSLVALGKQQHEDAIVARGMLAAASAAAELGQADTARQLALDADQLASRSGAVDAPLRVQAMIAAGLSQAETGALPAATARIKAAVALARQGAAASALPLAAALQAQAKLQGHIKQYTAALKTLDELLALATAGGADMAGRLEAARELEHALSIKAGQSGRALAALRDALALQHRLGAEHKLSGTLVSLSDHQLKQRQYASAREYAVEALREQRDGDNPDFINVANVNMGFADIGLGHVAEGKRIVEAVLRLYEKNDDKASQQAVLMEYGQMLQHAGDQDGAMAAYSHGYDIGTALVDQDRQNSLAALQTRLDAEMRQHQIDVLNGEKQLIAAEVGRQREQRLLWWLLAAVSVLTAAVIALLYRRLRWHHVQLKTQSALDPLTALYNRRHFQDFMREPEQRIHAAAAGAMAPAAALFLLDVDHFKRINDVHGHATGDMVLRQVAAQLRLALRGTDMIVRWGGEEFLAYVPHTTQQGAEEIALRILDGIAAHEIAHQGQVIKVSVSLGYAALPLLADGKALSWERSLNLIDGALYAAKSGGRNRACGLRAGAGLSTAALAAAERDLEQACRDGLVDLTCVRGSVSFAGAGEAGAAVTH